MRGHDTNTCRFALREIFVLTELALGYLRYHFAELQPQSNSFLAAVPSKAHSPRQRNLLYLDTRLMNILTIAPYIHTSSSYHPFFSFLYFNANCFQVIM